MKHSFFGGVHPAGHKESTRRKPIAPLDQAPEQVVIPVLMSPHGQAEPLVHPGDRVQMGQPLTRGVDGGVCVHASVSGRVAAVEERPHPWGGTALAVVLENDGEDTPFDGCPKPLAAEEVTLEQLVDRTRWAGIAGMGGGAYPTHRKLAQAARKIDTLIVNAAECEPYITADHRLMLERGEAVLGGVSFIMKALGLQTATIGIEGNKLDAVEHLKSLLPADSGIHIETLKTRYPQGAEKQLVQAVSGRQVPSGKLPADAGCCIFNLNTTCAIYRAVYTGMPVVNKIVTVSGSGVIDPKNIECPIGTPITKLFDACGGLKDETYKLIMGGPMMGLAQYDVDVTVGKGTGAMLAFADKEEQYVEDPQCIRCGKCVGVCPIRLEPVFMYKYLMKGDVDTWQNVLHGMDCIECGACTYTCPARLPLTHAFRLGKQEVNNARMAAKAKAEAEAKAAAEKKEA